MFQDHISFSLSNASSIGLIGVLAMLIPLFFYFAIRAIRNKVRSTIPVVPDLPTVTEQQRYEALVQRMAKLFHRIDPTKGDFEMATPLRHEEAKIETDAIFDEFSEILLEAHDGKVFQNHFRVGSYAPNDDAYGVLYLEDGDRGRFVQFLYDRLRVCGVERKFLDDVFETYCLLNEDDDEESETEEEGR